VTPLFLNRSLPPLHQSSFVSDIQRHLIESDSIRDVYFVVEQERVPAHLCSLCARCEYFRSMFIARFNRSRRPAALSSHQRHLHRSLQVSPQVPLQRRQHSGGAQRRNTGAAQHSGAGRQSSIMADREALRLSMMVFLNTFEKFVYIL
jgi:hypothetical protein